MLDKKSKIFLNYMDKQENKKLLYSENMHVPEGITDKNEMFSIIRGLKDSGYLKSIPNADGVSMGVALTHEAVTRKEMAAKEKLRGVWLYIRDNLIAFAALIISIISLLHSLGILGI